MKARKIFALACVAALGFCQQVHAAGFFLIEQSVSAMGNAYAGGAALADDASTVFFNVAGMTRLCGNQALTGGHLVIPTNRFKNDNSLVVSLPASVASMPGTNGHDSGELGFIPHFYGVKSCENGLAFGLGINGPFGLATDYGHNWVGRYYAVRSYVFSTNIQPSIAYRINNCLSIGAGFDVQYIHAKLSNMVDFGLIAAASQIGGAIPEQQDGKVIVKGNNWGFGGNFGILYEFSPCTRVGFHYRSQIKHSVEGTERFKDTPDIVTNSQLAAVFRDTRVRADVTLPDFYSFSVYHAFNSCWAIMADATWTRWKVLKRLRFRFKNPLQADAITTFNWENAWRYSAGVTWTPNECWVLRTGFAFDETPIKNKETRSPRLPGENRWWVAGGVGYYWSDCIRIDFGYAHLFLKDPKIDKTDDFATQGGEDFFRGGLRGKYDSRADIVSLQAVVAF